MIYVRLPAKAKGENAPEEPANDENAAPPMLRKRKRPPGKAKDKASDGMESISPSLAKRSRPTGEESR